MADPDASRDQLWPSLSSEEINRLRRFGTIRRYAAGQQLVSAGDVDSGMFVIFFGSVAVSAPGGLGHVVEIIELGPGDFLAEAGMLAGQPRLVNARAGSDTEVLVVPGNQLRTVLIAEAELGERIMRALLLRVGLIETGASGPVLIGLAVHPDLIRFQGFFARHASPALIGWSIPPRIRGPRPFSSTTGRMRQISGIGTEARHDGAASPAAGGRS